MKMLKWLTAVLISHAVSCPAQTPAATVVNDSLKGLLRDVSAMMTDQKNEHFVIVDLMADGFIKDGQPLDFAFDSTGVFVNHIRLPEPHQISYTTALLKCYKNAGKEMPRYLRMSSSPGHTIAEMLDPGSDFRKPIKYPEFDEEQWKKDKHNTDQLVDAMLKDGLLDSVNTIDIGYNSNGIAVNGILLKGELKTKYINLYKELFAFRMDIPAHSWHLTRDALYLHAREHSTAK